MATKHDDRFEKFYAVWASTMTPEQLRAQPPNIKNALRFAFTSGYLAGDNDGQCAALVHTFFKQLEKKVKSQ